MTVVDTKTITMAHVVGVAPLGGRIVVQECLITNDTLIKQYHVSEFPVEIPLGHTVYGTGVGENTADYNQEMKISVELIDPDGQSRGYKTWGELLLPSYYIYQVTGKVEIDKEGVWKFHVKLENAGVFDEKTWDAVATPGIKPEAKFPWLWLVIGAGALGLILVAKPKKKKP